MVSAAFAVYAVVVGALVLTGQTGLPLHKAVGPVHLDSAISMPVRLFVEVCDPAVFAARRNPPGDCAAFAFDRDRAEEVSPGRFRGVEVQNDVEPVSAVMDGDLALRVPPGWSPYVAAKMAGTAVWAGLFSLLLFQLSRFLRAGAAGRAFGQVDRLRGIGGLVIAMALLDPVISQLTRPEALGYGFQSRGPGPMLVPGTESSLNVSAVALGLLVVLVAEVLRRGAEIEAEQELTV
ncbi:hypothetical protein GCM10009815_39850 [Nocardioides marmoribigeumensis]